MFVERYDSLYISSLHSSLLLALRQASVSLTPLEAHAVWLQQLTCPKRDNRFLRKMFTVSNLYLQRSPDFCVSHNLVNKFTALILLNTAIASTCRLRSSMNIVMLHRAPPYNTRVVVLTRNYVLQSNRHNYI
jgi:hypothetical protein